MSIAAIEKAMVSDQKVLLDVFAVLPSDKRQEAIALFTGETPVAPTAFKSLTQEENRLMGAYLALPEEERDARLRKLVEIGTAEVRKQRRELVG